jgi:hypothetical protein
LSDLPQSGTTESITVDASSTGVSEVLDGPPDDALDDVEASKFVEAQLRCDLLRAQIRSVQRDGELRALIVSHSVLRIDCIVVLTVLAIGWLALFATSSDPLILRSLIFVLGITTMAAARSSHFRLQ